MAGPCPSPTGTVRQLFVDSLRDIAIEAGMDHGAPFVWSWRGAREPGEPQLWVRARVRGKDVQMSFALSMFEDQRYTDGLRAWRARLSACKPRPGRLKWRPMVRAV